MTGIFVRVVSHHLIVGGSSNVADIERDDHLQVNKAAWTDALPCQIYNHKNAFEGMPSESFMFGAYNVFTEYGHQTVGE